MTAASDRRDQLRALLLRRQAEPQEHPATPAQAELWFLHCLDPDSAAYNVPGAVDVDGPLDEHVLTRAVTVIVARHEALRTTFAERDGVPVQRVAPAVSVPVHVVDLSGLPAGERDAAVDDALRAEAARPFDLARGPLLRVALVRRAPDQHVLLAVMHHIVSDGWSLTNLVGELAACCAAERRGETPRLPPLTVQFPDFARWQHGRLTDELLAPQLRYWREHLAGELPILQLPADHARPAAPSPRGAIHRFTLPDGLAARLVALGRAADATLFMTLLSGFATLLSRYAGQDDLVIGSPVGNRPRSELEPLIGYFVNTVALRLSMAGQPTFRQLLAHVREVTLGAHAHGDVPFGRLVRELRPDRSLGPSSLFQAMFVLLSAPPPAAELDGVRLRPRRVDAGTTQFDLSLTIAPTGDGLIGEIEYSLDLFVPATIARMGEHLVALLDAAAAAPDMPVDRLPFTPPAEARAIRRWSGASRAGQPMICAHDLIARRAREAPDALAVVAGAERVSYGALWAHAERLRGELCAAGIGPEARVGVCMDRSAGLIASVLAVLGAGGTYVPLDPAYPLERLALMLDDARPDALLVDAAGAAALPTCGLTPIRVDRAGRAAPPRSAVDPAQLAYVIYTSGSTGRPKGAGVSHANLVNAYLGWEHDYRLGTEVRRHLQMASFSFDVFAGDLVRALCSGGTMVMCPREALLAPDQLYALLRREAVECAEFVPAVVRPLMDYLEEHGLDLSFMRLVVVGSDAWTVDELRRLKRFAGAATRVVNSYGLTEATIDTTFFDGDDRVLVGPRMVPIGRPFAGSRVHIVDPAMNPVPIGVPGELLVGGDGVIRGYWDRPGLTAERFIPDPFAIEPGARLYRTGDLARWLASGDVEFLGRGDDQVKIRGFRIELGEIEAAIASHSAVRAAAVAVRGEGARRRLVGYAVTDDTDIDAAVLREHVAARLPGYMVPSAIVLLPRLPLTPNGKVDRRALPAPAEEPGGDDAGFAEPVSDGERTLAAIWQEILRVARVGRTDNFFELGGDSILAIQVIARARAAGLSLTPRDVFQHQRLVELAAAAAAPATTAAATEPVAGPVALGPIQRWFFDRDPDDPHHWNQAVLLRCPPDLDRAALRDALHALVRHHDALRLRYHRDDRGWQQTYGGDGSLALHELDLAGVTGEELEGAIAAAADQVQRSLDLGAGPVFAAALAATRRGDRLLLVAHHLVVDGVSWRILLEDLETAYAQRATGAAAALPAKTTTFQEWSARLAAMAHDPGVRAEVAYWRSLPPASPIPVDHPARLADNVEGRARIAEARLGSAETEALIRAAQARYRMGIHEVLAAATARAFRAWGVPELRVDLEGHGREPWFADIDLSRTVGWCTAVYPVALPAHDEVAATLVATKEALRRVPRGGLGHGILRAAGELAGDPPAEVSLNYLGRLDRVLADGALFTAAAEPTGAARAPGARRDYLLEIEAAITGGELAVSIVHGADVHDDATMRALAAGIAGELRAIRAHCEAAARPRWTPSDVPLARLDQSALDRALAGAGAVEDVFALTAMQEGMLFHALHDEGGAVYVDQLACTLRGDLDEEALARAWRGVIARHPALRVSMAWERLPHPVQIVHAGLEVPFTIEDWRERRGEDQASALATLAAAERARGFDLRRPPLMRVTLVRLGDDAYRLIWTHHHILFDGWSLATLLRELFTCYHAERQGRPAALAPVGSYADLIRWQEARDASGDQAFWRDYLRGFTTATAIPGLAPITSATAAADLFERIPAAERAALDGFARAHRVTINTLLEGAWAIVLSAYAGHDDVLFGTTVAGRPADLAGVDDIVGLFINTVPRRIRVDDARAVTEWLRDVQAEGSRVREREHTPLPVIHGESEIPRHRPMFESLLICENHPLGRVAGDLTGPLRLEDAQLASEVSYPLVLTVTPGEGLVIHALYDASRLPGEIVARWIADLRCVLAQLIASPHARLASVSLRAPEPTRPIAPPAADFNF